VIHDDLLERLAAHSPSRQRDSFDRFVSSVGEASLRRDGGPEHVTASCFVFTPDFQRTLLCFHAKGRFWVQFGGHLEPHDDTVADAALREAREESGLDDLVLLSGSIVDLDRHELNSGFACHAHWDIGFAAVVGDQERLRVSDESEDLRWFPVEGLPATVPDGFPSRLHTAREAARALARRTRERSQADPLFSRVEPTAPPDSLA